MPKKILLADDSITIQKVVELTFSDGDYEVIAVNNGAKAIQKLQEFRPDIILSDIIMPEKNGYEVCEYVKSHPDLRSIPVVLLTGTFEPFDPDRADKAGCDAVVTKPFESQSLIHKVEELIQASRTAQSPAASAWTEQAPPMQAPPPQFMAPEPPPEAPVPIPSSVDHGADIFGAAPARLPRPWRCRLTSRLRRRLLRFNPQGLASARLPHRNPPWNRLPPKRHPGTSSSRPSAKRLARFRARASTIFSSRQRPPPRKKRLLHRPKPPPGMNSRQHSAARLAHSPL